MRSRAIALSTALALAASVWPTTVFGYSSAHRVSAPGGEPSSRASTTPLWKRELARFKSKPLSIELEKPRQARLGNGARVYFLPDDELPLTRIELHLKVGSILDPLEKKGLAELSARAWRSGGAGDLSPTEFDEKLESLGASLDISIGLERCVVTLSTLSKNLDAALDLLGELIFSARFDEDRFEAEKVALIENFKRGLDQPEEIAGRYIKPLLYGADSARGAIATVATLERITFDDARAFYERNVSTYQMALGISGDFDPRRALARLNEIFGARHLTAPPDLAGLNAASGDGRPAVGAYLVDRAIAQSVLRIGSLGGTRLDEDYHAALTLNHILGGNSFSSRLMRRIRVESGMAYSVWSYYDAGRVAPGFFMIGAATRPENLERVFELIDTALEEMIDGAIGSDEIELAKESIINSFAIRYDTAAKVMSQWLTLASYDYPDSYLIRFRENVAKVTRADLRAVAKKLFARADGTLKPMTTLIVGPASAALSSLGAKGIGTQLLSIADDYRP